MSQSGQYYFRWDIWEDLSEEVAFQLKPEGWEGASSRKNLGWRVLGRELEVQRRWGRSVTLEEQQGG